MGGCHSRDDRLKRTFFSSEDINILRKRFNTTTTRANDGVLEEIVGPRAFEDLFGQDLTLAQKLYNWIVSRSLQGILDFETYVLAAEILTGEPERISEYGSNRDYGLYTKAEILGLISFSSPDVKGQEFDKLLIDNLDVTYSQGLNFLKEVITMYFDKKSNEHKRLKTNDIAAKIVANGIFGNKSSLQFSTFFRLLDQPCPYISRDIQKYFRRRMLGRSEKAPRIPIILDQSLIFDSSIMVCVSLQNQFMRKYGYLQKKFSSKEEDFDYQKLKETLTTLDKPYFIFVRHVEEFDDVDEDAFSKSQDPSRQGKNLYAFGIFNSAKYTSMPVSDVDQSYIFSIIPKFKLFEAQKGAGASTQFTVLDKPSGPTGLGFGKSANGNKYRFWLDKDLEKGCYLSAQDEVYQKGFILEPHISSLKIDLIELWALTDEISSVQVVQKTMPAWEPKIERPPPQIEEEYYEEIKQNNQISCLLDVDADLNQYDRVNRIIKEESRDRDNENTIKFHTVTNELHEGGVDESHRHVEGESQVSCLLEGGEAIIEDEATILFRKDRSEREKLPYIIIEQKRDIHEAEDINRNRFSQLGRTSAIRPGPEPELRGSQNGTRNSKSPNNFRNSHTDPKNNPSNDDVSPLRKSGNRSVSPNLPRNSEN